MDEINDIKLNRIIHERARLLILTVLAKAETEKLSFNELLEITKLTSGNLSVQLKNLEDAGYIKIEKYIQKNKPITEIYITEIGREALKEYLNEIEKIIKIFRKED